MTKRLIISPVDIEKRQALAIRAGDVVRVSLKIQEKGKTRLQAFEGMVIAVKHGTEAGGSFTVRKVASGVGVERIFPLYSPAIDKIEVVRRAKVRRAKLYFIREKVARQIRKKMRRERSTTGTVDVVDESAPKLSTEQQTDAKNIETNNIDIAAEAEKEVEETLA
ncbi:MAG: 50S ribosomal protein L19 [Candidatus Vogelbacteria bacterium CG10_big_fil_rev_8_21_14_0_10_51_16]|uniref:Large ribosomal subunit protein bL19 n=1 Tax=Candidatus Vogelbacteria bacterium CG10_big_fil_rev_8_21_14_0_10_51_16 TaxID=1975045 RepID=A0A2H0REK0_9BACT|nr:MAG: 50S ribosomal protein L19 [Candidatus Vogelbacteria bacterium CG10_big_fil_rev_8_21_14_0_10_51_16]